MSVAESIVIFGPIRQVGWRERLLDRHRLERRPRPPAEGTARRRQHEPADLAGAAPARHWKSALCSESTGSRRTP
mgnify:CR=1 FL=1